MRRVLVLACCCLLTAGCGGSSPRQEAEPPSVAAAKAALERYARHHYGSELVEDILLCGSPDEHGTRTCSFSFAPQPTRPTAKVCGAWTVSMDRAHRLIVAPVEGGTCYLTGGPSGEILRP
jgi:hypothetical protein